MPETLTAEDLSRLAELIRKAGGIDQLAQHLDALDRPQPEGAPGTSPLPDRPHSPHRRTG